MYDILGKSDIHRKKDLTNPKRYGMLLGRYQLRCWNCNKLLGTGKVTEGHMSIKCPKCRQFVTVGIYNASLATLALEVLI